MVDIEIFKKMVLSFPETTEQPHFEKTSFKVGPKIFVTLDLQTKRACAKLSLIDQDVFSSFDKTIIFPVPNKWGKKGWTFIALHKIKPEMLKDVLTRAFCEVAPKRLSKDYVDKTETPDYKNPG